MYERLEEKHKILQKENLKAAPDKTYLMLKKVKFLELIIGNKKIKPLTSRIERFQKLKPHNSINATILRNHKFVANYVFGMQPKLQPLYQLLHKETEFKWTKDHQKIFAKIKQTITNN